MDTLNNLFHMGGPLFMGILTILLVLVLTLAIVFAIWIITGRIQKLDIFRHRLTYLKSLGLLTMITGILGQLVGLVMAFSAIERAGDISPQMIYGGLKISMYTTLYGIGIYLLALVLWFVLDFWFHKSLVRE
jgi:biopolymer transport protein ExbB/TolQ